MQPGYFFMIGFCSQGPESYVSIAWVLLSRTGIIYFYCMAFAFNDRDHMFPLHGFGACQEETYDPGPSTGIGSQ